MPFGKNARNQSGISLELYLRMIEWARYTTGNRNRVPFADQTDKFVCCTKRKKPDGPEAPGNTRVHVINRIVKLVIQSMN